MERDAPFPDDANFGGFATEDRMGFAVPVTPAHSLRLLNDYMRTDLLLNIHRHVREMMDQKKAGIADPPSCKELGQGDPLLWYSGPI